MGPGIEVPVFGQNRGRPCGPPDKHKVDPCAHLSKFALTFCRLHALLAFVQVDTYIIFWEVVDAYDLLSILSLGCQMTSN